jgi:hypothetical protein
MPSSASIGSASFQPAEKVLHCLPIQSRPRVVDISDGVNGNGVIGQVTVAGGESSRAVYKVFHPLKNGGSIRDVASKPCTGESTMYAMVTNHFFVVY